MFLYEPPFIVDGSRPPLPADLPARIAALVEQDRRGPAVAAFFREAMGIPAPFVGVMRLLPSWRRAKAIAHTLRYDFARARRSAGRDSRCPPIAGRHCRARGSSWSGSKSEPFFHTGAQALAELLPSVEYVPLEGGHHGSAVMSPAASLRRSPTRFRPKESERLTALVRRPAGRLDPP